MKAGWEKKKLGEVCEDKKSILRASKLFNSDYTIKYLDISSIDNSTQKIVSPSTYMMKDAPSRAQQKVEKDDIIISLVRPNLKNIALVEDEDSNLVASTGFCVLRTKPIILRNYLFYSINSDSFTNYLVGIATGANYPAVSESDIKNKEIPIPPIDEQEAIVAELDSLSSIIAKHKQLAEEYDRLEQSIFHDMFGDPVTNDKGWEVRIWNDVLKILNGKNQKAVEDENGTYPIYGSGGIMGYANDYICPENTIIIGRKGNIDRPIFVKCKFWNVDTAFGLVSNTELLNPLYLFFFCKCFNFQKLNKAVTIPSLTKSDLLLIEIPLPPLSLQTLFSEKIQHIEAMKAANAKAQKEVETLFAERMNYYFGE